MRAALTDPRPYLDWVGRAYDDFFNRGAPARLQSALQSLRCGSLNGASSNTATAMFEQLERLRLSLCGRAVRLDRILFEFETPVGPETFANIASVWWIVPAVASSASAAVGGTIHGASKITFTDDHEIVDLRELWAVDPFASHREGH